MFSCSDKEPRVTSFQSEKNGVYFKESFVNKDDHTDTLISLFMAIDTSVFYYMIRDDIPLHFSMERKSGDDLIHCSVSYEWDDREKIIEHHSQVGLDRIGSISSPYSGGLRISGLADFLNSGGKIKLLSNGLSTAPSAIVRGLGKKLKAFTGQSMIYTSCILDSDSVYLVTFNDFREN